MKFPISKSISLFILAAFILSGCGSFAAPTPTPTLTLTPIPTNTRTSTPVPTNTLTLTPKPTSTFTITPTYTATVPSLTPVPMISAKLLSVTTYPVNKRHFKPNEKYAIDVAFQNTGSESWTPDYCVAVVYTDRGDVTYQTTSVCVGQSHREVAPGEKISFVFSAFGSEKMGEHWWGYVLVTPKGKLVPGGTAGFYYVSE